MIGVFFDGAVEPTNPGGTGSYGFAVFDQNKILYTESIIIGKGEGITNNLAEYSGLLHALQWLYKNDYQEQEIIIYGDSKLVIEQMTGRWRIKKGVYVPVAVRCQEALKHFTKISFQWIPREENTIADALSKDVLKKHGVRIMER